MNKESITRLTFQVYIMANSLCISVYGHFRCIYGPSAQVFQYVRRSISCQIANGFMIKSSQIETSENYSVGRLS